ncbi:hypothetical protein [Mesomycoplasma ovipneumoniae]|uniref:hypothetical protein n=1 Tax=Mesomycoplasma ovipneumoniae TaxID=29562 RepID=UPI000AB24C25|nr:hypothetical protein [Mesomycoplasma ovipneumoniae]
MVKGRNTPWFIKERYCIENISIIDEELKSRNLLTRQEHQKDEEQQTQKPTKGKKM